MTVLLLINKCLYIHQESYSICVNIGFENHLLFLAGLNGKFRIVLQSERFLAKDHVSSYTSRH